MCHVGVDVVAIYDLDVCKVLSNSVATGLIKLLTLLMVYFLCCRMRDCVLTCHDRILYILLNRLELQ